MLSIFAIMWVSRAHLQPPCPQLSLRINILSEIHLPKVPYKGLELRKPPRGLHKATQGQGRDKRSPDAPGACTATAMWVPISLRSVYTHLEKISYFRCSGTTSSRAINATFLHNTWKARWSFQKTFGEEQRDTFGGLLPESRSGETSVRGVPGKPRPEPGGTGTLVLTTDLRRRLEGFSRCPAFHKLALAWGCGGAQLPIIICGKVIVPGALFWLHISSLVYFTWSLRWVCRLDSFTFNLKDPWLAESTKDASSSLKCILEVPEKWS